MHHEMMPANSSYLTNWPHVMSGNKTQQGSLNSWLTAAFWCHFEESTNNPGLQVTNYCVPLDTLVLERRKAMLWEALSDMKQTVGIRLTSPPPICGVALKCVEYIAQPSPCWAQPAVMYHPIEAHRAAYRGWEKEQAALGTSLDMACSQVSGSQTRITQSY